MTLILFDIDGTLTSTGEADMRCFAAAFQRLFGFPVPSFDWHYYTQFSDSGVMGEILEGHRGTFASPEEIELFEAALVQELEREYAANPDAFQAVPGAKTLIEAVSASPNHGFSLATGCLRGSALFKLAKIGIDARDFPGGFSNDTPLRSEIAQNAIARADEQTDDIVYVGDGVWDVRVAKTLGIRYLGVTWEADVERLKAEGATAWVHDFRDLDVFWTALGAASVPE